MHRQPRPCGICGEEFVPEYDAQRYCSRRCGSQVSKTLAVQLRVRKVERPPYDQLMAELAETNFSEVARTDGVSDDAVRKWVRWYEADVVRRRPVEPGEEGG